MDRGLKHGQRDLEFAMHSHHYLLDICMDIITDGFVE